MLAVEFESPLVGMNDVDRQDRLSIPEAVALLVVLAGSILAFAVLGPLEGVLITLGGTGIACLARVLRSPPEPNPPAPEPANPENPIDWIVEHDAHRYDPGYWTGDRVHPVLRAPRTGRYGVYLIFGSFFTLIAAALGISTGWGRGVSILLVVASAVELAAGWALVKTERKVGDHSRREK